MPSMKPYLKRPLPPVVRRKRASQVSAALAANPKTPAKLVAERDRFHRQVLSVRGKVGDYVVLFKSGLRRFPNRNVAEKAMLAAIRRGDKPTLFLTVKLPDAVQGKVRVKGREVIWTYPSLLNAEGVKKMNANPSLAAQARPIVQEVLRMHGLSNKFRISKTSFSGFGYGDGYFVTIEGWKPDRELTMRVKVFIIEKLSVIKLPSPEDRWVVEFKGPGIVGNPRRNIGFREPSSSERVSELKMFPPTGGMIATDTFETGVNWPPFQYVEAYARRGNMGLIAFGAYNAFGLIGPEQGGVALVAEKPKKRVIGTITIPYSRRKRIRMFKNIAEAFNWAFAARDAGFQMRYMPNPEDKQSDMKPGELVRRIHPYDGSAKAGRPVGKLLRVMQVKRHGPSTADDYIALLEDGEWAFTWNLARQGGVRRNPGIDPVEGAYRASDRRGSSGGRPGKSMKRCPSCGGFVDATGLCFRCQHPEIKHPGKNPGKRLARRWQSRGGRYWIELYQDDKGFSYREDNGGGNLGNITLEHAYAIVGSKITDYANIDGIHLKAVATNPGPAYHKREEARYKKLLRGDLKAGHREAADYWQGALSSEAASVAAGGVVRNPLTWFHVYLGNKLIDAIPVGGKMTAEQVRRSLIDHDGYDSRIRVVKTRDYVGKAEVAARASRNPGVTYHERKMEQADARLKRAVGKYEEGYYEGQVAAHSRSKSESWRRRMRNNPLLMVVPNPRRMNDDERRLWVLNDEGLYNAQQESGLGVREFVAKNRAFIDEVIANVTGHKKPAHYLAYPGPRMNPRALGVPERHQLRIALDTLKMTPAMAGVMGGMTVAEAKAFLKRSGLTDEAIAKLAQNPKGKGKKAAKGKKKWGEVVKSLTIPALASLALKGAVSAGAGIGLKAAAAAAGVSANPSTDMGTLMKNPRFRQAVALYRKFHGCEPKSVKRVLVPIGDKKRIDGREFFVSLGKAPSEAYDPPSHSGKAGSIFVHPYERKPEKVVSADGKTIVTLPGSHRVTDWIRG